MTKTNAKKKKKMKWNLPYLQFYSYLKLINYPLIQGSILGSIWYLVTIVVVQMAGDLLASPEKFSSSYDGIILDKNEQDLIRKVQIIANILFIFIGKPKAFDPQMLTFLNLFYLFIFLSSHFKNIIFSGASK